MAAQSLFRLEIELVEGIRAQVADEDVGRGQEVFEVLAVARFTQVEHDAPLSPVVEGEPRVREVTPDPDGAEDTAQRVTGRRFDLDHLSAPIGEECSSRGGGHPHPELDHPQVRQSSQSE